MISKPLYKFYRSKYPLQLSGETLRSSSSSRSLVWVMVSSCNLPGGGCGWPAARKLLLVCWYDPLVGLLQQIIPFLLIFQQPHTPWNNRPSSYNPLDQFGRCYIGCLMQTWNSLNLKANKLRITSNPAFFLVQSLILRTKNWDVIFFQWGASWSPVLRNWGVAVLWSPSTHLVWSGIPPMDTGLLVSDVSMEISSHTTQRHIPIHSLHDVESECLLYVCHFCSIYSLFTMLFHSQQKQVLSFCGDAKVLSFDKDSGKWWKLLLPKKCTRAHLGSLQIDLASEKKLYPLSSVAIIGCPLEVVHEISGTSTGK